MIIEDFYSQLEASPPGQEYLEEIQKAKSRALVPEQGYEIHHIHPTSLGGANTNNNKVKLTIFEHCKVHALLAKAIPCYKTLQPLTRMSLGQVTTLEEAELVQLEELYQWSELREKALHHPKSREHVEKSRQTLLARHLKRTPEHIAKMSRKGMIAVNNGEIGKLIYPEELEEWLSKGWTRGRTPASKARLSKAHTGLKSNTEGRKIIHFGDQEKKVAPEEVQSYLDQGWELGRASGFVERHRKVLEKNGTTNVGKVRIKKDGTGKMVPKNQLQSYLDQGWQMGIVRK